MFTQAMESTVADLTTAAICQSLGIVPIVEPEVLMDGSHDIAWCWDAFCLNRIWSCREKKVRNRLC